MTPKFKIGDHVRVTKNPKPTSIFFNPDMSKYFGTEQVIVGLVDWGGDGDFGYRLKDVLRKSVMDKPHWLWHEDWLEPIEDEFEGMDLSGDV